MFHPAILATSLRQSMSVRQSAERSMRGLGSKRAEMLLGKLSREMACITPPWPSGPAAAHRSEHRRSPAFAYTRHYTPSCPRLTPSATAACVNCIQRIATNEGSTSWCARQSKHFWNGLSRAGAGAWPPAFPPSKYSVSLVS